MKRMKKVFAFLLTMVMVLAMAVPAMAAGGASITINNSANGETYNVYKLFGATVTGTENGSIAYQGDIPEQLKAYFTKNSTTGEITATDAAKDTSNEEAASEGLITALKGWTETQSAVKSAEGTGTALTIIGLDYGYYVVTSTQDTGAAITVTSTNPNASINDKNTTPPVGDLSKTNDKEDGNANINDTVTYTVKFTTANYNGTDQIVSYTIKDTLPDFLSNVTVTSITIAGKSYTTGTAAITPQFDANGEITISWVDENGKNLYANGAQIVVTYTATVTEKAAIAGNGNTNKVTISYTTKNNSGGSKTETDTIYTYALAIKKVNKAGEGLKGATFELPFYVVKNNDGTYTKVKGSDVDKATNSVTTPSDGVIVIKGVAAGNYTITETQAPDGYNKLAAPFTATAVKTKEMTTNTTVYLDSDGNVITDQTKSETMVTYENSNIAASVVPVLNLTGAELPSTGGIGTTLFYVIGAICVLGAGVLLVTRRRMASK